ncbi:hypothetical protein E3N88_22896 [Mikania micrantha]|uniref:Uncharacterized protein n=1 Tax=Mikania micrantha TaxID=192012 RepID=A0A5N6NEE5_9ASTR|nr:hypothetical protein E3N88_22896 [Mikania micrantha]
MWVAMTRTVTTGIKSFLGFSCGGNRWGEKQGGGGDAESGRFDRDEKRIEGYDGVCASTADEGDVGGSVPLTLIVDKVF